MTKDQKLNEAKQILRSLGLPVPQTNVRSALCLLALLNLTPEKSWQDAETSLIGITPMMDFARHNYDATYAPNTRETFRRQTMHQFVSAGIALYNPDKPDRAVNSPNAVYQIEPAALELLQTFGTKEWDSRLNEYLRVLPSLAEKYARQRDMVQIPVQVDESQTFSLSPGPHSVLIRTVIEDFAPRFVPGSRLIYAGDTGDKWGYFDQQLLEECGVYVHSHGKMPDVVLIYPEKDWLILVEAVTSHGPVDSKRHLELRDLFKHSKLGLVYVTAFPSRKEFNRYLSDIAWETEVWVADHPTHLIHFNGIRFLGPYD